MAKRFSLMSLFTSWVTSGHYASMDELESAGQPRRGAQISELPSASQPPLLPPRQTQTEGAKPRRRRFG